MASLAAFPQMLERDRRREGLRVCGTAWLLGVTVREYRELETGDRTPDPRTYERMCEVFGWPRAHTRASTAKARRSRRPQLSDARSPTGGTDRKSFQALPFAKRPKGEGDGGRFG